MSSTSSDKISKRNNNAVDNEINNQEELEQFNPLVEPLPWWYRFYRRIRLVPWWLRYNIGMAEQADLRDKIVKLSTNMGLDDKIVKKISRQSNDQVQWYNVKIKPTTEWSFPKPFVE